jgi:hypothetical protein
LQHSVAEVLIGDIFKLIDVEIDICILEIEETNSCVDEDDSEKEECGHKELASVECH